MSTSRTSFNHNANVGLHIRTLKAESSLGPTLFRNALTGSVVVWIRSEPPDDADSTFNCGEAPPQSRFLRHLSLARVRDLHPLEILLNAPFGAYSPLLIPCLTARPVQDFQ